MMAVSLGMRISGLLVVGAVAVAVAAFGGDGSGTPDGRGGGSTVVTAGPSDEAHSRTAPASPTPRQSPAGEAGPTVPPDIPAHTQGTTAIPSASPTATNKLLLTPSWLPPGPVSPNSDPAPDPSSVYDQLRDPGQCRAALSAAPPTSADPQWRLLRALASACLAVQGQGGSWDTAGKEYLALAGKADTCKGRASYAVLGGLLDFHRQHPSATVRLKASSGGTPACSYRVAGVDAADAKPGDVIDIDLRGTYFDHAELLRYGSVSIGGEQPPVPPVLKSESGDELVLSVVVPPLDDYPKKADVVVRYGSAEARLPDALTVESPAVLPPADGGSSEPPQTGPSLSSGTPEGMFSLRPLPAHLAGAQPAARLRIP
ncbi:hypothetical protein ACQEWB_09785 [Streptomyces sp. CA-249302]|uniref:hypothetical protein n=1 Tax=Streptomyces sp. CA-249302 TaxID=3240058 RepID=UPI003D91D3E8